MVDLILGNLLILALYGFPMSVGEAWALADPAKAKEQPETESSVGNEAQASGESWTSLLEHLPHWVRKPLGVRARLVAGILLTAIVVVVGAGAFALYYHLSDQPEKVSQVLPRFAYWLPFALLGLVTDVLFEVFGWEDRRLRVSLRLVIWWLPRIAILAFAINPPILQDTDPASTALAVLAIDGVLAALFLWLYTSREQIPSVLR